jgi:phosphate acetyltransferase
MAGASFLSTVKAGCPEALLAAAKAKGQFTLLVVRAAGSLPMQAAYDAWKAGIASPLLIGEPDIIQSHAGELGWDISDDMILPAIGEQEAASVAAKYLIENGTESVGAVMKGQLHTDVFMGALLPRNIGLRTGNRLVHVFALYPPDGGAPMLISDAAVNVTPDEKTSQQAVREMVRLSTLLGHDKARIAILSATETPIASMPQSETAAMLAQWVDTEFSGRDDVVVSGPLSCDLALSHASAAIKGLSDDAVAGQANCLLMPEIVAGNILYKAFVYLAGACAAGIVVGGAVPILLTSRADPPEARLASIALASVAR